MSIPKSRSRSVDSSGQYFEAVPVAASKPRTVRLHLADLDLELAADRGVFGSRGVDWGTVILLKEAPAPPPKGDILDLGCGYGPIAITLARRAPDSRVWAIDINQRALELARTNVTTAKTPNVQVCSPDDVPADLRFAAIYSNPPVRVGKAPLHEMLLRWLPRLQPDGRAYLVVQKNLGSDSLASWLNAEGYPTGRLGSKHGFRILEISPRP